MSSNISLKETVYYILDQIYVQKVLTQMCSRLILKRLLMNLATEVNFFSMIDLVNKLKDAPWLEPYH